VDRRGALGDAALYGGAALFAALTAVVAGIPLYREWGRIAAFPYAAGCVVALVLAVRGARIRARALVAVGVLAGAALLPMALEMAWRAGDGPGSHAQSEVIVTEEAADALVSGRNPYAASYANGPLSARPAGTTSHFPYLPAMLVFGLPRAVDDHHPWADARLFFAAATLTLAAVIVRRWRAPPASRLRAFQLLAVLPTGALFMATGGDDLPVLALLLTTLVLASEGRFVPAGSSLGLAMAAKQTAWILLPFLLVALVRRDGHRAATKLVGAAAAVCLPMLAVFAGWNLSAFWEDVVRYPLGLGHGASPAATPTPGSVLVDAFPGLRGPLTILLVSVVAVVAAALLVRWPPSSVGGAAMRAACLAAVAIVAAPAARAGYLVYPVDLFVWGWLLSRADTAPVAGTSGTDAMAVRPAS
jgi:glycosyl transferase family 87